MKNLLIGLLCYGIVMALSDIQQKPLMPRPKPPSFMQDVANLLIVSMAGVLMMSCIVSSCCVFLLNPYPFLIGWFLIIVTCLIVLN
jgi:hypothetical protein